MACAVVIPLNGTDLNSDISSRDPNQLLPNIHSNRRDGISSMPWPDVVGVFSVLFLLAGSNLGNFLSKDSSLTRAFSSQ